jgi:hypothetical protein
VIQLQEGFNLFAISLNDKVTLSDPIYLFEFVNQITLKRSYTILADLSQGKEQYNRFALINQDGNNNALQGEIDLTMQGYYNYTVYEQVSTTNLQPLSANKIAKGIAKVEYTVNTNVDYKSNITNNAYTDKGLYLIGEMNEFLTDENNNYLS